LGFVDRAALYNLVKRTNLVHIFLYVYCSSLHVSANYVPIIRRKYHIYVTPGDKIEKNEMGGACSAYGGEERCVQGFGGET
jgi:hypothetical protein